MFHLLAYTALDTAGASNENIPAVTDGWATVQNTHYILPQDMRVLAGYYNNAGATNARLNTPALRKVALPSLQPVDRAAVGGDLPPYVNLLPANLTIDRIDETAFEASNNGAGAVRGIGGLWVSDMNMNVAQGNTYTFRFTSTITALDHLWTPGSITFDQTLPYGTYEVVGMDVITGAGIAFARLQFPGTLLRPGILTRNAIASQPWLDFRYGKVGPFGRFDSTAQPNLEIFGGAGVQTITGFLDCVKVR